MVKAVPYRCVLVGGQDVGWWAERFGVRIQVGDQEQDVTSRDIDFWGSREDLVAIATALKASAAFPNNREMTALVGAIALSVGGRKTALEMLNSVPGIDSKNRLAVAIEETLDEQKLLTMSPVSLVIIKLYALRRFDQKDRRDLQHLRVSLQTARLFIAAALQEKPQFSLWNCNRLIQAQRSKANRRLEHEHQFGILSAIPIESIQAASTNVTLPVEERIRLENFLKFQWPRIQDAAH
jgi:hypothetical protein